MEKEADEKNKEKEFGPEVIAKKFNIDLHKLEEEQKKLSKTISLKDAIDFELVDRIAGCEVTSLPDKLIATIVVLDKEMQIIEQQYVIKKPDFPYISGFRAYRELPAMIECYNKLQEQPDVVFFSGHGIAHPYKLGIASHFGISIQKPVIGIAQNLLVGGVKEGKIYLDNKLVGFGLKTREGSKPIYVSPGNLISLKTSLALTKKFLIKPHKLPEPLVIARKYVNRIKEEMQ